jgi:hypothetical protein
MTEEMTFEEYWDFWWRRRRLEKLLKPWRDAGFSWATLLHQVSR